jgi:Glycosyltransferase like family 2
MLRWNPSTEVVNELTGLIPTFKRPSHLRTTLSDLLSGTAVPSRILVSEGSRDPDDHRLASAVVSDFKGVPVDISVVPTPAFGGLTGNRNHLVSFVCSRYLHFLDDDATIHPGFVKAAIDLLRNDDATLVTAPFGVATTPQWFTRRCHWRVGEPGEPQAVSLSTVMGPAWIFDALPSDERIIYGYEEADFTFRLYRLNPSARVVLLDLPTADRGRGETAGLTPQDKRRAMESSRCFVAVNRYWDSRAHLGLFLTSELAHNIVNLRRPLPTSLVDRQWKVALSRIIGKEVDSLRLPS